MDIADKIVVVTGGAGGIGAELIRRFAAEGAAGLVIADIDHRQAQALASEIGPHALAVACDVSREADIQTLVQKATESFGRIDIYVSNAGILGPEGGVDIDDDIWNRMWNMHVMAHVWASRAVLPGMLERGEGYFMITASAAGLLNIVETAPYGVTKHAAVGLAEWLRIAYGRQGIGVSCLCPQAVRTAMTANGAAGSASEDGMLDAAEVAEIALQTIRSGTFLSLPHPEVHDYMQLKSSNYDRWLGGMQKLYARHRSDK